MNELATNAAKYGALSSSSGRVHVGWEADDTRFNLEWRETGGPPVQPPAGRGFGTRMIERVLAAELKAQIDISFDPDGLVCTIKAPSRLG